MVIPVIPTRIEQRLQSVRHRIISGNLWSLEGIAIKAGQRQVRRDCAALMFMGANVIDFVRRDGYRLGKLAVFAAAVGRSRTSSRRDFARAGYADAARCSDNRALA